MTTTPPGPTATPPSMPASDVVALAADLIGELRVLLSPVDIYSDLAGERLTVHLGDLKNLSCLTTSAQARAAAAYARTGDMRRDWHANLRNQFRSQGHSNEEAARLAKLANGLDDAPDTAATLADGSITPDTANAILGALQDGRLGDADAVEKELLRIGKDRPVEDVRRHVKEQEQRRDGAKLLKDTKRQRQMRAASIHEQQDGMFRFHAYCPPRTARRPKSSSKP